MSAMLLLLVGTVAVVGVAVVAIELVLRLRRGVGTPMPSGCAGTGTAIIRRLLRVVRSSPKHDGDATGPGVAAAAEASRRSLAFVVVLFVCLLLL